MELQWNQRDCQYLRRNVRQVQNLEQTQELRLPEGMPDIGRVLSVWGQSMLRSKEWRSEGMTVSGGVTAWVLYAPEDGSEPRSVEVWLPFSGKWSFPDSHREGSIRVSCQLRSLDARTLSARKLMVRATTGVLAEALEMAQATVYTAAELPQDVQILENTYPAMLPKEAGEKLFTVEETVALDPAPRKILACDAQSTVTEQTAAGGRAVFRGHCRIHLVYMGEDDRIRSGYYELPFAQFAELDRDYDKDATATVMLAVSGLETQLQEGQVQLSCSLVGQYVVYERTMLTLSEDAYSPVRTVQPQMQMLSLPMLLEHTQQQVEMVQEKELSATEVVDVTCLQEYPTQYRDGDRVVLELPGTFQVLFYDEEGNLRAENQTVLSRLELPAGEQCSLYTDISAVRQPGAVMLVDKIRLDSTVGLDLLTMAQQEIPMITALTLGEQTQPDPMRPSLILQRSGGCSLWELAKCCGSTVDAICKANQLVGEPTPEQMLLIPVL